MEDHRLSGSAQENLLVLLCFDDAHCRIARAALTPQLFESAVFKEVAGIAIDFIDQYGEAVKDHLPDHLEHILKGDDSRKAATYKKLLDNLFLSKDSINAEYVMSQLQDFVRLQTFKSAFVEATEALRDGNIEAAEKAMSKGMNKQVISFNPGLNFSDNKQMLKTIDEGLEDPGFNIGIKELDRIGIIPRRKQLYTLIAPRGRGKSWFVTHCAKWALVQRWKVLIVSLEMSERAYGARLLQSLHSISKTESNVRIAKLVHDKDGRLEDVLHEEVERLSMREEGAAAKLKEIVRTRRRRPPLYIKEFPTKGADLGDLEAYLDQLERFENFVPDVIIIDYPDLLKHDSKNKRVELGQLVEQIRGIGVKRNAAMISVSQGNRDAETATTVTGDMAAEDISKLATADVVLTLSQTAMEFKLGLARILVEKARDRPDGFSVLITQAYAIGQFCLDSTVLHSDYWDMMKPAANDSDGPGRRRHKPEDERRRSTDKEERPVRRARGRD